MARRHDVQAPAPSPARVLERTALLVAALLVAASLAVVGVALVSAIPQALCPSVEAR